MTESFMRHFISFIGMVIIFFAWFGGYVSAGHEWWWVGFGCIFFYIAIYSILKV